MEKEELFAKRMQELARTAYNRDIVLFSEFLDLHEQNMVHSLERRSLNGVHIEFSGGYGTAERQMAAFVPDALSYVWNYPFVCLSIRPDAPKYAQTLTHRDFLGAILHTGIERSVLGDILVEDNCALVFCQERIADFLIQELTMIRHTAVTAAYFEGDPETIKPKTEEITGTVASVRLDSVIALAFHTSRSSVSALIPEGRVFVNGKLVTSNGCHLNEGDLISVRGMGKFRFQGTLSRTKKGRELVQVQRFV
ncbi:MAG: YlmH/Sll1252 family protein [Lachnospiraceae bacterium]|nr:YlmH/Sll1252 family protein [Lachnospiraceae bacterium]